MKEKTSKLSVLRSLMRRIASKLLPLPSKQSATSLPRQEYCVTRGGIYCSLKLETTPPQAHIFSRWELLRQEKAAAKRSRSSAIVVTVEEEKKR